MKHVNLYLVDRSGARASVLSVLVLLLKPRINLAPIGSTITGITKVTEN